MNGRLLILLLCAEAFGASAVFAAPPVTAQAMADAINSANLPPGTPLVFVTDGKGGVRVRQASGTTATPAKAGKGSSTAATASATPKAPDTASTSKSLFDSISFDRPISAVPAFTALDISPETVSAPTTPRDLAASLLNGVDRHGALQSGIALETAPFRVFHVIPTDINTYRDDYLNRLLYNFSFSLATSKASDKSDAAQLALGFSTILYQDAESDPRRNQELEAVFDQVNLAHPVVSSRPNSPIPDEDPNARSSLQAAANQFRERAWAGTTWSASVAPTWSSKSGNLSDFSNPGFSAWSTFAYGPQKPVFGNMRIQFLAEARYQKNELVVDPDDKTQSVREDSFIGAGRLRLGTTDFNAFGEAGYVKTWHGFDGDGSGVRAAGGIERRIAPNMWLVLSVGQQFGGSTDKSNQLFAIGSFRFGSEDTPQFSPDSGK